MPPENAKPLTLRELRQLRSPHGRSVHSELLRALAHPENGDAILDHLEFPEEKLPDGNNRRQFARAICEEYVNGTVGGGLEALLAGAASVLPGNEAFARWRQPEAAPDRRAGAGCTLLVRGANITGGSVLNMARQVTATLGVPVAVFGYSARELSAVLLPGATPEQGLQVVDALHARLRAERIVAEVELSSPDFLDYALRRINIVGPDQRRMVADNVPASTSAGDLAQATISTYPEGVWPRNQSGRPRAATVDLERDGQQQRLDPDRTLHDNGVRDGDTVHVHPESTAGIDPRVRDEALARVRSQIVAYAVTHADFTVEANAQHAPTEYLLRFRAPGWGPPEGGSPPVPIDDHAVFLALPEDFPMVAPMVFWQSPIFHPNIHAETGTVCLGELADRYRPSLDFGELCQTLREIAAYRNFGLQEGFYNRAAAEWAGAFENQSTIEQRGGRSLLRRVLGQWHQPRPVRIRRIAP